MQLPGSKKGDKKKRKKRDVEETSTADGVPYVELALTTVSFTGVAQCYVSAIRRSLSAVGKHLLPVSHSTDCEAPLTIRALVCVAWVEAGCGFAEIDSTTEIVSWAWGRSKMSIRTDMSSCSGGTGALRAFVWDAM